MREVTDPLVLATRTPLYPHLLFPTHQAVWLS
jgi:hypothetical protein